MFQAHYQLLLVGEGARVRPHGRGGVRRAEALRRRGEVRRRVLLPRVQPAGPGDRGPVRRPRPQAARRRTGRCELVHYLHGQDRYEESIAAARAAGRPGRRTRCSTGRSCSPPTTGPTGGASWRRRSRPPRRTSATRTAGARAPMASLADSAVECKLYPRAVAILGELIPLHQRTQPNRGVGNGTLSRYYQQLAAANSALGQTTEAIDAASAAIVGWGGNVNGRAEGAELPAVGRRGRREPGRGGPGARRPDGRERAGQPGRPQGGRAGVLREGPVPAGRDAAPGRPERRSPTTPRR